MFERILLREILDCPSCKTKRVHCRVRSKNRVIRGQAVHGWECEGCGSIRTDSEGAFPEAARKLRGYG